MDTLGDIQFFQFHPCFVASGDPPLMVFSYSFAISNYFKIIVLTMLGTSVSSTEEGNVWQWDDAWQDLGRSILEV